MRSRFLSLLLAAAMLLSLAACGAKTGSDAPAAPEDSQGATPGPVADPTPSPTPELAADPTTSPTPEPVADPTVNPTPDTAPGGEPPEDTPEPIADAIEVGEELTEIRGGTNQNDALMLPLNTKL